MEFTPKVRDIILQRSGGRCEGCGEYQPVQIHHRLYKSRGGRGTVPNGLALCGLGNTGGCHGIAHTGEGMELGWAIPSGSRPELWPAWRPGQELVLYDDEGGFEPITAATARLLTEGQVG